MLYTIKKKKTFFLRKSFEYYQNERVVFFNWLIIKLLIRKFAKRELNALHI